MTKILHLQFNFVTLKHCAKQISAFWTMMATSFFLLLNFPPTCLSAVWLSGVLSTFEYQVTGLAFCLVKPLNENWRRAEVDGFYMLHITAVNQ